MIFKNLQNKGKGIFYLMLFTSILIVLLSSHNQIPQYDLVQYWSSAKLLSFSKNPYDQNELLAIQRNASIEFASITEPSTLYLTPLALPILYPLHMLDFQSTKIIMLVVNIATFFWLSLLFILQTVVAPSKKIVLIAVLASATFAPFYSAIWFGQYSLVLFSGWILFLLTNKKKPIFSGIALSLTLAKPHLLYLIYLLIILNIRQEHYRKIFLGMTFGCVIFGMLVLCMNHQLIGWYLEFSTKLPIHWATFNLGSWLQILSKQNSYVIRFVPTIIFAILVTVWAYNKSVCKNAGRSQNNLDWNKLAPWSILSAPYGWLFDCVILYPTLIATLINLESSKQHSKLNVLLTIMLTFF